MALSRSGGTEERGSKKSFSGSIESILASLLSSLPQSPILMASQLLRSVEELDGGLLGGYPAITISHTCMLLKNWDFSSLLVTPGAKWLREFRSWKLKEPEMS